MKKVLNQSLLYRYILLKIQSKEWVTNQKILSERQLSLKFSLSRADVRKILANLCEHGLLDKTKGYGYYVAERSKFGLLDNVISCEQYRCESEWIFFEKIFNDEDLEIFKSISMNANFYGKNFSRALRSTYYDDKGEPVFHIISLMNRGLISLLPKEMLDLKDYQLFALNGYPVVYENEIFSFLNNVKLSGSRSKETKKAMCCYRASFTFNKKLVALSKIVYLKENTRLENLKGFHSLKPLLSEVLSE